MSNHEHQKFKGDTGFDPPGSETDHLVDFNKTLPAGVGRKKSKRFYYSCLALVFLVLAVAVVLAVGLGVGLKSSTSSARLADRVTIGNLMQHLQALEDIANSTEQFSRAVQYGYNASADMVFEKLLNAGYEVIKQHFLMATYENNGGSSLSATFGVGERTFLYKFALDSQYSVMWYSKSTNGIEIGGNLTFVDESCATENYTAGTVALVEYVANETEAGCSLLDMVEAAAEAEVLAVIMMRRENDSNKDTPPTTRIYSQSVDDFKVSPLPVLGATNLLGQQLKDYLDLSDMGTVMMSLSTDTTVGFYWTYNVLAYSDFVRNDSIVVVGSHLDSVPAGPGINDNGSGSAANLEMALQLIAMSIKPINQVLFAFWGAEELGLLGSTHFVSALDEAERSNISLNLNYDMIGSPNFVRMIYNGSGAENEKVVNASSKIQALFEEFFISRNLNYSLTEFNGRSDYGPFIAEGVDIPAGGLFTGAEVPKTEEERIGFGGLARASLDPCYHQACDTVANVNQEAFIQMAQASAYVLDELMMKEDLREFLES